MKCALVGKSISPACQYGELGRLSADGETVLCVHRGICPPYESCHKFSYDPLKRIPKPARALELYDTQEFSL